MGRMQAMWSSKRLLADLYAANERIGHGALHLRKHSLPWSLRPVRRDEDPISAKSIKSSMRYVVEDCIRHVCGLVEEIACDLLKMLGFVCGCPQSSSRGVRKALRHPAFGPRNAASGDVVLKCAT